MRPFVAALLLSLPLGGCAGMFGSGGGTGETVQNVPVSVDSTLRIAATQLQHHGYSVQPVGQSSLVTIPRPVPDWLGGKDPKMKGRQWFVQVSAESHFLARGTEMQVVGFLVPEGSTVPNTGTTATAQNAIQVTDKHPLYEEVRAIATWIGDEARRKK